MFIAIERIWSYRTGSQNVVTSKIGTGWLDHWTRCAELHME
jgi:hypothetical protein